MGIMNKMDAVMDWCMEGSTATKMLKFFGVAGVAACSLIAIVAAPFVYVANENERSYHKAFNALDRSQVVSFVTSEQCVTMGYSADACKAGFDSAMERANGLGTVVTYSNLSDCAPNHGAEHCFAETTSTTVWIKSRNTMVPITTVTTSYKPPVVGWQAATDNLGNAVPLYPTSKKGVVVRADGKQFTLGDGK